MKKNRIKIVLFSLALLLPTVARASSPAPTTPIVVDPTIIVQVADANNNIYSAKSSSESNTNVTTGPVTAGGGSAIVNLDQKYASFLAAPLTSVNLPAGSSAGTYGHLPTQFDLKIAISVIRKLDGRNFKIMVETMKKSGSKDWDEISGDIISSPLVKNRFSPLRENESVCFLSEIPASGINDEDVVGIISYNSKLNKKQPVLPTDFLAKVYSDASKLGANRAIFVDQFCQAHLTSSADGLSVGGALSWISKCFTFGQSTSAGVSTQGGNSTQYNNAGVIVILYREDAAVKVVVEKSVYNTSQRIVDTKNEVVDCYRYCYNNLTLRNRLGRDCIESYVNSGDVKFLNEARYHFEVAERNLLNGWDIKSHQVESTQIMAGVYYLQAGCILLTDGKASAISFAKAKKLERIPTGFSK